MLRLFLDVADLRVLFQTTVDQNTGQANYLTKQDFRNWLMCAVNWLGFAHVDFQYDSGATDCDVLKQSVHSYEGMPELYNVVKDMFDHPALNEQSVYNCYGFIDGDILYLVLDVGDSGSFVQ